MNVSCDVVKDLLPLYHDKICSGDSRELVEEHLETCPACRAELSRYDEPLTDKNVDEARLIADTARVWKKNRAAAFFKGALLVSFGACLACGVAYKLIGSHVEPDGTLVEPFGLIPLAWLFALLGVVFTVCFAAACGFARRKKHLNR